MTRIKHPIISRLLCWLLALTILLGTPVISVKAADEETLVPNLTPADLSYEDGNIILHKTAERIGPDEWKVTVRATIGEMPIEKRQMEVVFLLDISSSMKNNNAHTHSTECNEIICGKDEHAHTDECYDTRAEVTCGINVHTHTDGCKELTCTIPLHTHIAIGAANSCYTQCTRYNSETSSHWYYRGNRYRHYTGTSCTEYNGNYYYTNCDYEQEHPSHTDSCYTFNCGHEEHTHTATCYPLNCTKEEHTHTNACRGTERVCGITDVRRIGVAVQAAENLIGSLPKDTVITRLAFDGSFHDNIDSYHGIATGSGTYMWTGIYKTLTGDYFSDDPSTKKVFVVLTDGEASSTDKRNYQSSATTQLNNFKNPDGTDGTVFTVGFGYDGGELESVAGNGGYYMYAEDATSLMLGFEKLEQTLTAMLEDPMGTTVNFDRTSIDEVQTSGGTITSSSDTIYWLPKDDGSDSVRNSTIEYSYTVKLNTNADINSGEHVAPLNNPTYFRYGIKSSEDTDPEMKEALFPIPIADYALSSVQTKWQYNGSDILPPLDTEKIFSDYQSATYFPAFQQDYKTITPVIPVTGSHDYYRYTGTTVTANGQPIDGVDAVDATQPVHYEVIHNYVLVESNELPVNGSKVLVGRDFMPGDSFTFTLTPITPGAPMPPNSTVTINPESGTSEMFSFGNIVYTQPGTYTYSYVIQEQAGADSSIIYDTTEYTLVVTVTDVSNEMVVTYTLNGVDNGYLTINNRLKTGQLGIQKRSVTSHIEAHQDQAFDFLIEIDDASSRPLSGAYAVTKSDGTTSTITFTNGFGSIRLKAGETAVIDGLPDGATYTVTEDTVPGFTAAFENATGEIEADQLVTAVFDNTYHSTGLYEIIGRKQLDNAVLARDQFTFVVKDEDGNVVFTSKNNADGAVFFGTLRFTEADIGTKKFTVSEVLGDDPGIIYDRTVYDLELTVTDDGKGHLTVTDNLDGQRIQFTNTAITNQLIVSKKVEGDIGSKNREFSFTLTAPGMAGKTVNMSTDGGATYESVTLNAQGKADFTLGHDQTAMFYPVTGTYTVTENEPGSYSPSYSVNQGESVNGATASGTMTEDGARVDFVNTLQATTPTGVHTSNGIAVTGLCLAACLLMIARKRRCCD